MLFRAIPRRDVKPLAKDLLKRFGSLSGVLAAPIQRLKEVDGISKATALELKILQAAFEFNSREDVKRKGAISSWTSLLAYRKRALRHETHEQFRILYLERRNQLLADAVLNHGALDHAPVYPRKVARRALEVAAASIILVRNHPSGDPTPSKADVDMTKVDLTKKVVAAASALGVTVNDHLVIGSNFTASFKTLGLMSLIPAWQKHPACRNTPDCPCGAPPSASAHRSISSNRDNRLKCRTSDEHSRQRPDAYRSHSNG